MSTAITAENIFSGKGSIDASPRSTATTGLLLPPARLVRRASCMRSTGLYSRLVTRPARFRNSSVAAPAPAPISRTCSPNSVPDKSHGTNCFCVTLRQNDEAQNQFSNRFTAKRPIFRRKRSRQLLERATSFSGLDYDSPWQDPLIAGWSQFAAAPRRIGRHYTPMDFRAAGKAH